MNGTVLFIVSGFTWCDGIVVNNTPNQLQNAECCLTFTCWKEQESQDTDTLSLSLSFDAQYVHIHGTFPIIRRQNVPRLSLSPSLCVFSLFSCFSCLPFIFFLFFLLWPHTCKFVQSTKLEMCMLNDHAP